MESAPISAPSGDMLWLHSWVQGTELWTLDTGIPGGNKSCTAELGAPVLLIQHGQARAWSPCAYMGALSDSQTALTLVPHLSPPVPLSLAG